MTINTTSIGTLPDKICFLSECRTLNVNLLNRVIYKFLDKLGVRHVYIYNEHVYFVYNADVYKVVVEY